MQYQINPQYMGDFAGACAGYGLDDVADQMSYYKDFVEGLSSRNTDVSPEELGRRYALSKGVKDAFYDLDDGYFDRFIDKAKGFGVDSDDFLLQFWDQQTRRTKKTERTPDDLAFQAKREYAHSPLKTQKKLSIADLDTIRAQSTQASAESPNEKVRRFNQVSLRDEDKDALRDEYASGFYWMYKYEGNPKFVLVGNTVWDGVGSRDGDDVRLCFSNTASKDAFCQAVWPSRQDPASDHVKSGVKKTAGQPTSSATVTDKNGEVVSKWRKGRLQGYRNDRGEWVDILEDDPIESETFCERRERMLAESAGVKPWMLRLCGGL